jgi:hypothetical protein
LCNTQSPDSERFLEIAEWHGNSKGKQHNNCLLLTAAVRFDVASYLSRSKSKALC